ncbi:uncharacterized protein LOC126324047 [Schistocerca gregaria]|uniref:uncharacterized protein LOC126324047 n=1 Tax=Schistocerca gregaria TaxID=7010 RepID=UPI00211E2DB9|nr:uncharacterized protein LOC126324047 [Schistocerca gregaria]
MKHSVTSNEEPSIHRRKLTSKGHGYAAGIASAVTTTMTYPLDLIRTRFQVQGKKSIHLRYKSTIHAFKNIVQRQGIRGLYEGIVPALIGASMSWSLYLYGYTNLKNRAEKSGHTGTTSTLIIGTIVGAVLAPITNPIWVVKTRLQLQYVNCVPPGTAKHYNGMIDAFRKIWAEEGFSAFYKGLVPSIISSYHGAVQISTYDAISRCLVAGNPDRSIRGWEAFFAGGFSKILATISTQPLSVIKARLREQNVHVVSSDHYSGFFDAVVKTYKHEKLIGFAGGFSQAIQRMAFNSALFFYLVETLRNIFRNFDLMCEPAD